MKDSIAVVDDFFDEKELNIINNNLHKITFKGLKNKNGLYGFGHPFLRDKENEWIFDKIKKVFIKDMKLKSIESSFRLKHNYKQVLPHEDTFADYAFLCFLKGKELLYNGTGFYNDKNELDRYVGFKENRALFYSSRVFHTDLQALGPSSSRYSMNIFYKYA
tara:strand:+ start:114 stop:599 length:486 start_codon:yes stop_codon:yes gene_type:complete